jgi:predicted nucleotidyltransferase
MKDDVIFMQSVERQAMVEVLNDKREEILRIAARHGAKNVRVFGSAVRGELRRGSDIDLLVEVGKKHSAWFPAGLITDLEDLLGCKVDVVTQKSLYWYIRDRVLAEAVPL